MGVRATDRPEEVGPVELALFAVKSYDTDTTAQLLAPLLGGETAGLTLQNGVENIERLSERIGRRHILGGACYIFAAIASPGVITHTGGPGRVVIGELDGRMTPRAQAIRDAFGATGVPVELSSQIVASPWEKELVRPA